LICETNDILNTTNLYNVPVEIHFNSVDTFFD